MHEFLLLLLYIPTFEKFPVYITFVIRKYRCLSLKIEKKLFNNLKLEIQCHGMLRTM